MDLNRFFRLCPLLLAAFVVHAPASAQYAWIDEHGTHVFSDRPPPPGTPPARILKAPRAPASPSPYAQPAAAGSMPTEAAKPAAPTLAERDAAFRKRTAQREADERNAAQDAQRKADLAEQCAAARRSEASLTSGMRVTDVDDKGERSVLTDEDKARRLARARRALADCR